MACQNGWKSRSPVTLVQGNCAYGNLRGVKRPLTINTIMVLARGCWSSWLPSTAARSAAWRRSLTFPRLAKLISFPECLLYTKSSLIYISSKRRITSFCQSGQDDMLLGMWSGQAGMCDVCVSTFLAWDLSLVRLGRQGCDVCVHISGLISASLCGRAGRGVWCICPHFWPEICLFVQSGRQGCVMYVSTFLAWDLPLVWWGRQGCVICVFVLESVFVQLQVDVTLCTLVLHK